MSIVIAIAIFSFVIGFSVRMYYDYTENVSAVGGLQEHIPDVEESPDINPHTGRVRKVWHDSQYPLDKSTARVWEM